MTWGDGTSSVEAIGPPCGGKSECRKDEDEAAIAAFAVEHRVAAICHFCVATFIVVIVLSYDLGLSDGFATYSFNLHRELMDTDFARPIQVQYCAKRNSLPVQRWWCAVAWCLASSAQHWNSYHTLLSDAPSSRSLHTKCMAFNGGLFVAYSFDGRMEILGQIVIVLTVASLISIFFFIASGGSSTTTNERPSTKLKAVSRAKWKEYALSSTLMHVVVNCIAGVINAHELVLLCGYMVVSMVLVQLMDSVMDRIESSISDYEEDVRVMVDYERPFVALFFFAKLSLTVAITIPVAFDAASNRWEVSMEDVWCPL